MEADKDLEDKMKPLIVIRGPLGIGKSTISRLLAEKINAKYFSVDKILEENKLDREDNNFTAKDFIKANKLVLKEIKDSLKERPVIIDGNFYFKEAIEHLEKEIKNTRVFNLKAPLEICISRDKSRKIVYGEQAAKEVYALVSKFEYGTPIDTEDKTAIKVVKEIIGELR
ncbi:Putative adenylate kinase [uncultured archaeon]|nr:Putative adenylate kinase [uncultured archaeon]